MLNSTGLFPLPAEPAPTKEKEELKPPPVEKPKLNKTANSTPSKKTIADLASVKYSKVKGPRTASTFFYSATFKKFRTDNPTISHPKAFGLLMQKFAQMDETEKAEYEKKAEEDKSRYEKELAAEAKENGGEKLETLKVVKARLMKQKLQNESDEGSFVRFMKERIGQLKQEQGWH